MDGSDSRRERDYRRGRRLADVFGDVLPETTGDERANPDAGTSRVDPDEPEAASEDRTERWYRENRPPHHG